MLEISKEDLSKYYLKFYLAYISFYLDLQRSMLQKSGITVLIKKMTVMKFLKNTYEKFLGKMSLRRFIPLRTLLALTDML